MKKYTKRQSKINKYMKTMKKTPNDSQKLTN